MPTEPGIIPRLSFYPNDRPIESSLIGPIAEPLQMHIDSVRSNREPAYAYIMGAKTMYITYPRADHARMDIYHMLNEDMAITPFIAFDAARASARHDVLLREAMLDDAPLIKIHGGISK